MNTCKARCGDKKDGRLLCIYWGQVGTTDYVMFLESTFSAADLVRASIWNNKAIPMLSLEDIRKAGINTNF